MPLWKKAPPGQGKTDFRELENSVQAVRDRLRDQQMPLADLFAMLGEDDGHMMSALAEKRLRDEGRDPGEDGSATPNRH